MRYVLDPSLPPAEEVARILGEIAGRWKYLARGATGDGKIHEARLLVKKSRAFLWLVRPALGRKAYAVAKGHLRAAAGILAGPRDVVAALSTLEKLKRAATKTGDRVDVARIYRGQKEAAEAAKSDSKERAQAFRNALHILCAATADVLAVVRKVKRWPAPQRRAKKAFHAMHKSAHRARDSKDDSDFHDWRKKAKRLFYILQLTQGYGVHRSRKMVTWADTLQSDLGDYHDQSLAADRLARSQPRIPSARRVLAILTKSRIRLRKKVWKLQQRIEQA
jgi:CHAD domain-containing protein